MPVRVKVLTLGMVDTNAWLVGDDATGDAILIDPVDDAPVIVQAAADENWTIRLILATHAHFDHIIASAPLKAATGAPFWIHEEALPMLQALPEQGARFGLDAFPAAAEPDRLLADPLEPITVGSLTLEPLYTPGHAPGHLAFWMPELRVVFGGDALFYSSIGRTDLPGGDLATLVRSITKKLFPLGDDVRVLSGHGPITTIGKERRTNPYLIGYADDTEQP